MLFENDDPLYRISICGTCFLAKSHDQIFAVTAKHNTKNFSPKQYRVTATLGRLQFLKYAQPFTADRHREDFEDFVLIPIEHASSEHRNKLEKEAIIVDNSAVIWPDVDNLVVTGFPSERNAPDYDSGCLTYNRVPIPAKLVKRPDNFGIGSLRAPANVGLASFDGLSGSPVVWNDRLIGIVVRGSRDTSVSQLLHFVDARVIHGLVSYHLNNSRRPLDVFLEERAAANKPPVLFFQNNLC